MYFSLSVIFHDKKVKKEKKKARRARQNREMTSAMAKGRKTGVRCF